MKSFIKILIQIIKQLLFWLILFDLLRIIFIIFNFQLLQAKDIDFSEIIKIFWYDLALDISFVSYLFSIIWIIYIIGFFISNKIATYVIKIYYHIISFVIISIWIGETGLYPEWKTKLNTRALEYLKNPSEILLSGDNFSMIILSVLLLILAFGVFYFVNKFLFKNINFKANLVVKLIFVLILPVFIFLGARGGVIEIPISQSQSYFSKHAILNDISVNTAWNLVFDIIHSQDINDTNIFATLPQEEAEKIVEELHAIPKDTTVYILKETNKPINVIIILLESWSADLVHSLGGIEGITPNFAKLEKEGLLFTHIYSSGNRSQQGIASIWGGFPALPITTLTTVPEKFRNTPTLTSHFNEKNYTTAFFYGGQLRYGNIKAYLYHNKFDIIKEESDYENTNFDHGKLGYHDVPMLQNFVDETNKLKQPFFSCIFTLSSHSPYDMKLDTVIDFHDSENKFLNSAHYTDKALGLFYQKAKKQEWFDNTLIVLVADHSHNTYRHWENSQKEYRHIPMLFLGGALKDKYKGKSYNKVCSQTDLTKTLLKQLKMKADEFKWSKNLFNPYTKQFAYFELNLGFGWVRPDGYLSYNRFNDILIHNTYKDSLLLQKRLTEGKAYLQVLFQEYIDY